MKRNFIMIVAAVVAVLAFWSCKKEVESPGTGESSKISISVTGEIEDFAESDAKASIGIVTRLSWVDGDEVFVYSGTKKLGTLTVSLKKSDNRYAYLGGTIMAPTDGSTKLTCVYAKGIETAPEIDKNGEVRFSMASQTADDTPFVVYGTMDYSPGQTEISDELVNFEFATAVVLVNCVGLANGVAVTNAELSGINTNCVLSLSGTAAPEVSGEDVGTITTSGDFTKLSGNGKLYYQIGVPVSDAVNLTENPTAQRKLTVTQQTKTRSTNFTSSAFAAGGFANVAYKLEGSQYTVTLVADPTEGGSVTFKDEISVTSKTVSEGTELTIVATANEGYGFTGWTKDSVADIISTDAEYQITVEADVTYTAKFTELIKVSVVANPTYGGTVTIDGEDVTNKDVTPGTPVTIAAIANAGYEFTKWSDGETDASREVTVNENVTYMAEFEESQSQADGSLPGVFTINANGDKVKFSQGNLQYQAKGSDNQAHWRFAEHQYDFVGGIISGTKYGTIGDSDNGSISIDYEGWIDLFGWGTSGFNTDINGNSTRLSKECYQPWSTATTTTYYYLNGSSTDALSVEKRTDWGCNEIKVFNGKEYIDGKPQKGWRTLTAEQWNYIIGSHDTELAPCRDGNRFIHCYLTLKNNTKIYGILLFPDGWKVTDWPGDNGPAEHTTYSNPKGSTETKYRYNFNGHNSYSPFAEIDEDFFNKLQGKGVVFLPETGFRSATTYSSSGKNKLYYYAANPRTTNCAYFVFSKDGYTINSYPSTANSRYNGYAVRLVTDVPATNN